MSRSDSEGGRPAAAGFTLIELLIALAVSALLGAGLVRFYRDSYHAYSLQDQIQERDQNAHFAITRFTEILQQAGSGLPDTGWSMVTQSGIPPNVVTTVAANPRNAMQFIGYDLPLSQFVPVSDASQWLASGNTLMNVNKVLIDYANPAVAVAKIGIDTLYNANGFVKGVKDNASGMDSIRLTAAVDLSVGDRVYGYREDQYFLSGTNLMLRPDGNASAQMVLAENIDSLAFAFKDAAGNATSVWKNMRSASITVRARTAQADPRYPGQYRKLTLPMNVILRNRI